MEIVKDNNFELKASAYIIEPSDECFPQALKLIPDSPEKLYVLGNLSALQEGIAMVGARRATPYGISVTQHFASLAAKQGLVVISGGAEGCDSAAHRGALKVGGKTVVFLGGGCNRIYPRKNKNLFQKILDNEGAIVSELPWTYEPMRHTFLNRNRLIAALSKATLIAEAGLPSGTFSTADHALRYNKDVLAIPGAITNDGSLGCNTLIYQGARPIINDEVFLDYLFSTFECSNSKEYENTVKNFENTKHKPGMIKNKILEALLSQAMTIDELYEIAKCEARDENVGLWLSQRLVEAEQTGRIAKFPNGMYGPVYKNNL